MGPSIDYHTMAPPSLVGGRPPNPAGAPHSLALDLDEDRIRQVVDNLLDNTLRFAPGGSAVEVTVTAQDGDAAVEVADRGPGFPPSFLPHAFERFRRPDDARRRDHGGVGLGLSIVKALVEAHPWCGSASLSPRRRHSSGRRRSGAGGSHFSEATHQVRDSRVV